MRNLSIDDMMPLFLKVMKLEVEQRPTLVMGFTGVNGLTETIFVFSVLDWN